MHKLSKETIEMLWQEFDVPTNDLEEILESFCGWCVFTDREEIWHWFDEQYAEWGGVHALMFPDEHKKLHQCKGGSMRFNTHGGDSLLNHRSGEEIEIVRKLDPTEYDEDEVGPMYRVRFADGSEVDAFVDEIEEEE